MMPTPEDIKSLIERGELGRALRGETAVFTTPAYVNANPLPTDHSELLENGIYPLVPILGITTVQNQLEHALLEITVDPLGVYCAMQCFYVQVLHEDAARATFAIDRQSVATRICEQFVRLAVSLKSLELHENETPPHRRYRETVSRMRILQRDHGIKWPIDLADYRLAN